MGEELKPKTTTDPRAPGRKVPEYVSKPEEGEDVDLAGEDSFPASDPPSYTVTHTGVPRKEAVKPKHR